MSFTACSIPQVQPSAGDVSIAPACSTLPTPRKLHLLLLQWDADADCHITGAPDCQLPFLSTSSQLLENETSNPFLQTAPSWKCNKPRKSHTETQGLAGIAPPLFLGYSTRLLSHLRNSGEAPPLHNHFPSIPTNQLCLPCRAAHRHRPPASRGSEMAGQGSENHTQTTLPCHLPGPALSVHSKFQHSGASSQLPY